MRTDPTRRRHRWAAPTTAVAVAVVALVIAGWRLTGGQWQVVATPSMGEAAPVGTLVLTREVDAVDLGVGDIITFHPPGRTDTTFTHRIVEVTPTGGLHTRGDANGAPDPWELRSSDVVGEVVARWWGLGWLFRALPLLILGWALVWAGTRLWAGERWRTPLRVFGSSFVVAVCAVILRPFVDVSVLMSTTDTDGTTLTVVSTGLMPVQVSATGGAGLHLLDGQVGSLLARPDDALGGYRLVTTPALTWGWWMVLGLLWSLPMLWCWWRGHSPADRPPTDDSRDTDRSDTGGSDDTGTSTADAGSPAAPAAAGAGGAWFLPSRRRVDRGSSGTHRLRRVAVVAAVALAAAAVPETTGAFNAAVANATTTASSSPYFTCVAAERGQNAWVAYSLADALPLTLTAAADSSVNARNGTYNGVFTATGTRPCPRDTTLVRSITFGASNTFVQAPTLVVNPQVFSVEVWFRTTTPGGRLIGFGSTTTGQSPLYDRHVYLTNSGQLVFGAFPNAFKFVTSPASYSDGAWHHVVATLGPAGTVLYVDGAAVAADPTANSAQVYNGYWRVGWDNLATWPSVPTNYNYRGDLAFAAVYTSVLTPAQVRQNYAAGI